MVFPQHHSHFQLMRISNSRVVSYFRPFSTLPPFFQIRFAIFFLFRPNFFFQVRYSIFIFVSLQYIKNILLEFLFQKHYLQFLLMSPLGDRTWNLSVAIPFTIPTRLSGIFHCIRLKAIQQFLHLSLCKVLFRHMWRRSIERIYLQFCIYFLSRSKIEIMIFSQLCENNIKKKKFSSSLGDIIWQKNKSYIHDIMPRTTWIACITQHHL